MNFWKRTLRSIGKAYKSLRGDSGDETDQRMDQYAQDRGPINRYPLDPISRKGRKIVRKGQKIAREMQKEEQREAEERPDATIHIGRRGGCPTLKEVRKKDPAMTKEQFDDLRRFF